ncbi:unnamed protein product, partial [marine sediment metagenome]
MNICKVCGKALKTCTCEPTLSQDVLAAEPIKCPLDGKTFKSKEHYQKHYYKMHQKKNVLEAVPAWGVSLQEMVVANIEMIRAQNELCYGLIERVAKLETLAKIILIDAGVKDIKAEPEPY